MKISYLDALQKHRLGNLDEAEKLYRSYLEDDPQNSEVLHLLSILLAAKGDFLSARFFAESALDINPDSGVLHISLGNIMHNLGNEESAITHYQTALKLSPKNASAHNNLGNVYYRQGKLDDAKDQYYQATLARPNYVDAHYNLGLVLIKQGQNSEAKEHLELVLGLQPDNGYAHSNLGYLLQSQGEFDLAEHHYRKSLETVVDSELSNHNLGVILINKGKLDSAIPYFEKVLDLNPDHEDALHNLGAVFLLQKKSNKALPYFLRLSKLTCDLSSYYNLGAIYLDLFFLDEAIINFKKVLEISPDNFAANVNLGAIYLRLKNFAMAEKYYLKASELYPDNEEIGHILLATQQKNAKSSPPTYIKHLFDQYSSSFEKHAEILGYRAPEILFEAVSPHLEGRRSLAILDLGCGTGLGGEKFKPFANKLVGIDISGKMLELAAKKNIYTDLKLGAIEDRITELFDVDLIIAIDSLVYFGELFDLFAKCYSALKEGGVFAFTVETTERYPYFLQRSVRFAHSERYIEKIARQNNFMILHSSRVILRKEGQGEINGTVFVLKS